MSQLTQTVDSTALATPLATHQLSGNPSLSLKMHQGALAVQSFTSLTQETASLLHSVGIYDLGYRTWLRITGEDRVRWLNGMVTNTVQDLAEDHLNYTFILNAQGRIQGDADIYRFADHLLLETDRLQSAHLLAHLDRFIIMDDVELQELDASATAIGIAGPRAAEILAQMGVAVPEPLAFAQATIHEIKITVAHLYSPIVPRFEIWVPTADVEAVWSVLTNAGAIPCGIDALEALRILEATPLYGIDIHDKHLAQETNQTRALNFSKGCYLGQEIVERIRSRANVHRGLQQFELSGNPQASSQPIELRANDAAVGELTSIATYQLPEFTGTLALGFIRNEALERKLPISYDSGTATALDAPPNLLR